MEKNRQSWELKVSLWGRNSGGSRAVVVRYDIEAAGAIEDVAFGKKGCAVRTTMRCLSVVTRSSGKRVELFARGRCANFDQSEGFPRNPSGRFRLGAAE
jgi:hypothetical protein